MDRAEYYNMVKAVSLLKMGANVPGIPKKWVENYSAYNFYVDFTRSQIDRVSGQPMTTTALDANRPGYDGTVFGADEPVIGVNGLLTYGAYTNLVTWSEDTSEWSGSGPWTQTVNLTTTGTYTISAGVDGATAFVTAGTATIDVSASATYGSPDQFEVTGVGTVVVTTDTVDSKIQLTKTPYPMPYVKTEGSAVSVPNNYSGTDYGYKFQMTADEPGSLYTGPAVGGNLVQDSNVTVLGASAWGWVVNRTGIVFEPNTTYVIYISATITSGACYPKLPVDQYSSLISESGDYTIRILTGAVPGEVFRLVAGSAGFTGNLSYSIQKVSRNMGMPLVIDALDGAADGELLTTGSLESAKRYQIISTETDHFGSGVVVGNRVTGLTTSIDANNTVREISPAQGEMVVELSCPDSYDVENNQFIVALATEGGESRVPLRQGSSSLLHRLTLLSYIDPTHNSSKAIEKEPFTSAIYKVAWGDHPTLGDRTLLATLDGEVDSTPGVMTDSWFMGVERKYLCFGLNTPHPYQIKSIKIYKEPQSW